MNKSILLKTGMFLTLFTLIVSCANDDTIIEGNNEIIGSWKTNQHWGSIDGTETITFSQNMTYSVELVRTENFNGSCEMDPYCDNDYSGEYWFDGNKLYYNHSTIGWTDYFDSWSVEDNILILDGERYDKK